MKTDTPETPVEMAADLLVGAEAISKYTGLSKRQVYNCVEKGDMPFFRIEEIVYARPTAILAWLQQAQRDYVAHCSRTLRAAST